MSRPIRQKACRSLWACALVLGGVAALLGLAAFWLGEP